MSDIKRHHPVSFKVKVAIEALKEIMTMAQISSQYGIHSSQVNRWKKDALEILGQGFSERRVKNDKENEELVEELYKQIGQLKVELDWLKKKSDLLCCR